jgi:hypothetical protein
MRRAWIVSGVAGLLAIAGYAGGAAAFSSNPPSESVAAAAVSGPIVNAAGTGESLILVIGGLFPTRAEAESSVANAKHELQGHYVTPVADYAVVAGYADVRSSTGEVQCSESGITDALGTFPELATMNPEQVQLTCQSAQESGENSLSLYLDTRLERIPLYQAGDPKFVVDCDPGARCLGGALGIVQGQESLPQGQWMAASAFRTKAGAEQFISFMRDSPVGPPLMVLQVVRIKGSSEIGLGQESRPDGTGPAVAPLANQGLLQQ